MPDFRRYLLWFFVLLLGWTAVIAALNAVVDPYAIIGSPRITGFNAQKPVFGKRLPQAKLAEVARLRPQNLVLGNSRADRGIDPFHHCWNSDSVYNMAIPGSTITDLATQLQYAATVAPLERVVVDLDFLQMFNIFYGGQQERPEAEVIRSFPWNEDRWVALFSVDALRDSLGTITKEGKHTQYSTRGHMHTSRAPERGNYLSEFEDGHSKMQSALAGQGLYAPGEADWRYTDFAAMLGLAHELGLELIMVISPVHQAYLDLIDELDAREEFGQWKARLSDLNIAIARQHDKVPFPLWDFALRSKQAMEPIPADGEMQWHQNFTHYSVSFGDLMLNTVLGCAEAGKSESEAGVLLRHPIPEV